jgi:hypothetical protein
MPYLDDADSARPSFSLPPSGEAVGPENRDGEPFSFWPALAFPSGGGVSWGYASPWCDYQAGMMAVTCNPP